MATVDNIVVPENSIYASAGYYVEFAEGDALLLRESVDIPADKADRYHPCKAGENIRLIAYQYYKNYDSRAQSLWWLIAEANQIHDPSDLSEWVGKNLRIPDYPTAKLQL